MSGRTVIRTGTFQRRGWDGPDDGRDRRYRKAMALKDEIGLTDDERYSLALLIPSVDKDGDGSWKDLNAKQLHDLITMMEGWVFIEAMRSQRLDTSDDDD